MTQTIRMWVELPAQVESLKKAADKLYFSMARQLTYKMRFRMKKYLPFLEWIPEGAEEFWNHPLTKKLFEIWSENIEGVKRGWRADAREGLEFFNYMYQLLQIAHDPKATLCFDNPPTYEIEPAVPVSLMDIITDFFKSLSGTYRKLINFIFSVDSQKKNVEPKFKYEIARTVYENFQNSTFSLKMVRPNNQVHMYISYSFAMRPLKKFIHQYFDMSVISGDYEIIFKRYPPYHWILTLNAAPGQRTFLDTRGLDLPPIIYKSDLKFNVALHLNRVQTRSNNRFITCPVVYDPELEKLRMAEIAKKEQELKGIFPSPAYISGIDFGKDGSIYLLKSGKLSTEVVQMYGARRSNYLQKEAELNLLKAVPRPSPESGLIIRFNLLHPIVVLLEGINGKREVTLDEIKTAWKCLDLLEADVRKPVNEQLGINKIIDTVFSDPSPPGIKDETLAFFKEMDRLIAEDPTEEKCWKFVIDRFLEGKARNVLQAICIRMMQDGFDIVFSLWPLLTGTEITMDESGEIHVSEKREEVIQVTESKEKQNDDTITRKEIKDIKETRHEKNETTKLKETKKTLLPLLEVLKREMEALLKNVFTKYLDISAPTNRFRSEPILAGMIVEYCLNTKMNTDKFKTMLTDHLKKHYKIHYDFLEEYLKGHPPEVLHKILKLKSNVNEMIQEDVEGIIQLIHKTRERLLSSSISSRLLCFIDPHSVDVQIGNFIYEGKGLEQEEQFLAHHQERQLKLSELESEKRREVEEENIKRKANKEILEGKLMALKTREAFAKAEVQFDKNIKEAEIFKAFSEAKFRAIEALKEGDIKRYALLSMLKAHHDSGIEGVEEILEKNPHLVMAIDPHLHHHQEIHEIKHRLMGIIEQDPKLLENPVTAAMLLSEDFKDIVAKQIYEKINETFADILKIRHGHFPFMGGFMGGVQNVREQHVDEQHVKQQHVDIQKLSAPPTNNHSNNDTNDQNNKNS